MAERIRNPTFSTRLREVFGLSYAGSSPGVPPVISSGSVEKLGSIHQPEVDAEKIKGKIQVVVSVCVVRVKSIVMILACKKRNTFSSFRNKFWYPSCNI